MSTVSELFSCLVRYHQIRKVTYQGRHGLVATFNGICEKLEQRNSAQARAEGFTPPRTNPRAGRAPATLERLRPPFLKGPSPAFPFLDTPDFTRLKRSPKPPDADAREPDKAVRLEAIPDASMQSSCNRKSACLQHTLVQGVRPAHFRVTVIRTAASRGAG